MVILEMCHSPPGHSYSLALQVGSSNSLVFIHLEKENSGPKLITVQEHEGKKKKKEICDQGWEETFDDWKSSGLRPEKISFF